MTSWARATVEGVFRVVGGGTPSTTDPSLWNGSIPWVTSADILDDGRLRPRRWITAEAVSLSATNVVPAGSILVATRVGLGKVGLADEPTAFSQDCHGLIPNTDVLPAFAILQLRAHVKRFRSISRGTTIAGVTKKQLLDVPFDLPPRNEQAMIVSQVDAQTSRLDAAGEDIATAAAKLPRYRDSLLTAACLGRLNGHAVTDEDVPDDGPEHRGIRLPRLPARWHWSTFERVAERVTVGHVGPMKTEYVPAGIPFLRSQNVRANRFDPAGLKYIGPAFHERLAKSRLQPGDIVVVRSGDVGTACAIPDNLVEANCADLVIIQRPREIDGRFAAYYLNSVARQLIAAGRVGVALTHFNTRSVAELPVPVPPIDEQMEIVEEVDRRLSVVEVLEEEIRLATLRAQSLSQRLVRELLRPPRAGTVD